MLIALSVVGLVVLGSGVKELAQWGLFTPQPAIAQSVELENAWQQVYQQLPNFPRENQYVSKETGKVASDNTLVSRLIRYHIYIKGRAPNYRLDWKLTLADYLGVNEIMEDSRYPGSDNLRKNPVEGDRAAIGRLNRKQRNALVQALVNVFNGNTATAPDPDASQEPSKAPTPVSSPDLLQP